MSAPAHPNQIDVAASLQGQLTVVPEEHADERAVRLKTLHRQSVIEDWKGVAVLAALLTAIIAIGGLAAYESVFDSTASMETRRWSQTILAAVLSGGISFVAGRKMAAK